MPGTVQRTKQYLETSLKTGVETLLILPIVCMFTLTALVLNSEQLGVFAFGTYLGLVAYMAANAGRTQTPRIKDLDEPKYLKHAISVVLFLYLNTLIFIGTTVGYGFHRVGLTEWAVFMAILTPAVDATLARFRMPSFGLIGQLIILLVEIAARILSFLKPDSAFLETLGGTREYLQDLDELHEELLQRMDASFSVWA
jgi:hypothetical protein